MSAAAAAAGAAAAEAAAAAVAAAAPQEYVASAGLSLESNREQVEQSATRRRTGRKARASAWAREQLSTQEEREHGALRVLRPEGGI